MTRLRDHWKLLASALLGTMAATAALGEQPAPGFPTTPKAPKGAPNVLIIMTDDVGYASSSTFGGAIPTPTFDRLAMDGVRFVNFHTTSICSPTRAALLTGRNHHAVGFGTVADLARAGDGYNSVIPKGAGTIAQILSASGYDTAMLGKHHNTPTWQSGPLGPFDQWPSGLGFNYFYGFNGGHTHQFSPSLIENNSFIETPSRPGYILDRDLADRAIDWLQIQRTEHGDKPFLMYYAPGSAHTPLHAPADWLARFRGKFDAGWDVYREQTLERQKRLGIVPANAILAPMPPHVPAWSSLTPDQKRLYARHMEAYAAALAYCDAQIGRVIENLRVNGQLENTLVIYIQGDNGAEGSGLFNYAAVGNGVTSEDDEFRNALANIDEIGGPKSYAGVQLGWAMAMNTPFPYYKTIASQLGGIMNGMVVSWPARFPKGQMRSQFTDVTDVLPTVLEAAGIAAPAALNGVSQLPLDGISFNYTITDAKAPAQRRQKYFEVFGHAGFYKDGWFAGSRVKDGYRADISGPWELFDLSTDPSQTKDVSARFPEKLAEMRAAFMAEAKRNHVLPVAAHSGRSGGRPEPMANAGRYVFLPSAFRYPEGSFPQLDGRSWTIEARVHIPAGGANGVVVTQGGQFSGWGLVFLRGVPTFLDRANNWSETLFRMAPAAPLQAGDHIVRVEFTADGPEPGRGGRYVMKIDGRQVAEGRIEKTAAFRVAAEDATIGYDAGTALTEDYSVPGRFSGRIESVTIETRPRGDR
jgi:arylsulfatase A-like enzyme